METMENRNIPVEAFPNAKVGTIKEPAREFNAVEVRNKESNLDYDSHLRSANFSGLVDAENTSAEKRARGMDEARYIREQQAEMSRQLQRACNKTIEVSFEEWDTIFTSNSHVTYPISLTPSHLVSSAQSR